MEERLAQLEHAVADLARTLQETRRRVAELEARGSLSAERPAFVDEGSPALARASSDLDLATFLSLAGRTCLVLGGAYLLRALTDGGTLPRSSGTALGFAYAVAWLALALRGRGAGRAASDGFHVLATVLTAFPLVWESTVRVQLLSEGGAAAAMSAVTALALAVAWHRRAPVLAWIVTWGGILTAVAMMAAAGTGQIDPATGNRAVAGSAVPMTLYLAFLGVVTLWFAYRLDWTWLRWPPAIVVDATVALLAWNASEAWHGEHVGGVMLAQLALFAGYLVSFTARTLWRSRRVVPFEVVQTVMLLVVCFGGAVSLMLATGANARALGIVSVVIGACSYAAAFAFVDWRGGHWVNFVFYASLGVIFILAGTALVAPPGVQAIAWGALALVTAVGGTRYGTVTLGAHATIYAVAAALASGLLAHATDAFAASAASTWAPLLPAGVIVLGAAAAAAAAPVSGVNESWGPASRVPKILLSIVLLWSAGGMVCAVFAPMLGGHGGPAPDAAILASLRTAILAGSVLLLAWAGRGVFREGRWLSYAVLVAGGVKLLVEDFPQGRPSTLFLSLAVYGCALIVGPRLRVQPRPDTRPAPSRVQPI